MPSEITTAAELEALHMAVSEAARAACVEDRYGDPWLIVENDGGDLIAWSYPYEDYPDIHNWKSAESLEMPLTVLYRPDRPAQPTVQPTVEAVARAIRQAGDQRNNNSALIAESVRQAQAALALIGGRTEAEVKAEALEEAAEEFASRLPDGTGNGRAYNSWRVAELLRARAAAIRGEQP